MNIGEYSVRNKVVSWMLAIVLVGGGVWGFQQMGKLEDPAFTIKQAKVIISIKGLYNDIIISSEGFGQIFPDKPL